MRSGFAASVVLVLALAGCETENDGGAADAERVSACEVDAQEVGAEVLVEGAAWRLPPDLAWDAGFVLSDGGCSVFVAADRLDRTKSREGTAVEVRGAVLEFDRQRARRLLGRPGAGSVRIDGAPKLRVAPGAPLVSSFGTTGEDLVPE
jgi:hypothetical protein